MTRQQNQVNTQYPLMLEQLEAMREQLEQWGLTLNYSIDLRELSQDERASLNRLWRQWFNNEIGYAEYYQARDAILG